jgi:hypothetical protein
LLYGVEVKFYSARPHLSKHLETEVAELFAVGDGAGVTRGLMQASASGLLAGREIRRRLGGYRRGCPSAPLRVNSGIPAPSAGSGQA